LWQIITTGMALVYVNGQLVLCAHENSSNLCRWHSDAIGSSDFTKLRDVVLDANFDIPQHLLRADNIVVSFDAFD
jgi:hypothetical protein